MDVLEEGTEELLGWVDRLLIHPDTGKIVGFFLRGAGIGREHIPFIAAQDVHRMGLHLSVRRDALSESGDLVRLRPLLEQPRPILGQRMRTESGKSLGRCRDVQFDSRHLVVTWLFPKKFFRWGIALPLSAVREVTKDAIIVRDAAAPQEESAAESLAQIIPEIPEVAEAFVAE